MKILSIGFHSIYAAIGMTDLGNIPVLSNPLRLVCYQFIAAGVAALPT